MNKISSKFSKRLLALLLCAALVLPMFPQIVYAQDAADTLTSTGTLVADGVVAAGSLTPGSDALGSGKISLVPVTGDEQMIQDAVYAFVSNDKQYIMSHNASASTTGKDTSIGSISIDAAVASDGIVTIAPEDWDSALWIIHQHRYVPYATKSDWKPTNELPAGSQMHAGYRSAYYPGAPSSDKDYQFALKFGTSAVAVDQVFFGIFPRKGVSDTDGSYWFSDSTTPNRFLNWGDFVFNSTTPDYTLPVDDILQDAEQTEWYTCYNTAMVRLADGSYICFRYRNSDNSDNRPDILAMYCDDSGTWGVQRYFTASNGSTPDGAKPITDLFEVNTDGTLKAVKSGELEKLKLWLYKYEVNAAAIGYSTYYGESKEAVIAAIQDKTTVYDIETAETIEFTDTATLGCCYVDPDTWTVKYVHDDGTEEVLATLTVYIGTLSVQSGLSSQRAVTSKNSSFASTVYVPNVDGNDLYVSSTDEPVTFTATFGTQQVVVGVTASMLYDAEGVHIDTAVPNSNGADYTVKLNDTQVGTLKVYVADTTIAQQMPSYPAAGSVVVHKDKTTSQEAFALNGVGSIQLSAAGKPATNGVDLIVMVDLSSSMRYSLEGDNAMYGTPYYGSNGTLNTAWTEAGWQATRMYAMEESLKEMVTNLQGSGVDVDIAIADFGDLDHYDFDGASLLNNSAYPQLDTNEDKLWNSIWGKSYTQAGWYELANHLNYVLGSNDNGLYNNKYYTGGTSSQCRPFNLHEWKYRTDLSGVSASMLGKQPSKIHTGDKATIKGAFSDVESLNMTDVITSLRISNSMMLGTNYDLGLEYMYKIAYERKQVNIANGEDREIICIFMSDGAAMQYNYFSGSAHSNAWNDYLAADIDSFARSPYSWSLEENEDGTLAQFANFHPVVKSLLKSYHAVLSAGNLKYYSSGAKYNSCGCAASDAGGESFLKCLENVWNTMWPSSPYKGYTWKQILKLQTTNIDNTTINNALWYAIKAFDPGLHGDDGRYEKYYSGDGSYMASFGEEYKYSYGEAMRAELARVLMLTNDGSYATYSPFSYFYNGEGKNWWAEAIKGDTGKLYPVINKYANGTTHVEGESNPSTYNGDVVNNFSGETTQGLALSGQDYISGFRGLGLDIYSIGFALGTEGDNCITASTMNDVLTKISSGTNNTNGTNKYFFLANDQEALNSALSSVVDDVTEGASKMWFTDTMGEDFDLLTGNTLKDRDGNDIVLDFVPTVSVNLYNADINGKPTTLIRTLETIEFTGTKTAKSTVYNGDGTVTTAADVWDDDTDMISGSKVHYNAGTATYSLKLDDSGLTYPLAPETFFWTIGNLPDTVISLEYQIYLTGSMEGKYDDYGATTIHDTNESAVLHYRDVQGNDVTQEPESPTYTWDPLPGGIIVDKTVESVQGTTDEFTLTLEAYGNGSAIEVPVSTAADIVMVLDQSSTMYTPVGVDADRISMSNVSSVRADLADYAITDFEERVKAGDQELLDNAKHLGYYIAIYNDTKYNYIYIVQYAQNAAGEWGWYYVPVDQTVRTVEVDTENATNDTDAALKMGYDAASGTYQPYGYGTYAQTHANNALLGTSLVTYYQSQYGALYDTLQQFVTDLKDEANATGLDHRVAVVGFSSPFYDGWTGYDGTGIYVDGNYHLYDSDYKYVKDGNIYDPDKVFGDDVDDYSSANIMASDKFHDYNVTAQTYADALVSVKDNYDSVLNSVKAYKANYQQTCPSIGISIAQSIFAARESTENLFTTPNMDDKQNPGSPTYSNGGNTYAEDQDDEHLKSTYTADNAEDRDEIIILFTDGVPTVRCSSDRDLGFSSHRAVAAEFWTITAGIDDVIDHAYEAKQAGIQIYGIGTSNAVMTQYGTEFFEHVSSDDPTAQSTLTINETWTKDSAGIYFLSGASASTAITNSTYSDQGYTMYASDEDMDLGKAFDTVYESIVSATPLDETAVLRDVLSDYFVLSSDQVADIKVYTADYLGKDADGQDTFSDNWELLDNATVELTSSEANGRLDTINVSGFDYRENYVGKTEEGELHGKKLIVQVAIKDREGFWGGNNIPTNESTSAVYDVNEEPVAVFPEPQVNIPVAPVIVAKDQVVYYGEEGLDALDHLVDSVTIGGMEVTIDPDTGAFAPDADWMDDFADLSWNGSYSVPASTIVSGTESKDYTFGVVLTPKTDGKTNSSNNPSNMAGTPVGSTGLTANDTGSVDVLVPVITFEDSTIWLGDPTDSDYFETVNREPTIQWVNQDDPDGLDKGAYSTIPTEGFETVPSLSFTYSSSGTGDNYFKKDTPISVEVHMGQTPTDTNKITDEVYFDWIDCDSDNHDDNEIIADDVTDDTAHRHKGSVSSYEFYIHVTGLLGADAVVIDFGIPVDVNATFNDILPDGAVITGIKAGTPAASFANEEDASFLSTIDSDHGSLTLQADGKLRYASSDMEMNVSEIFQYQVKVTRTLTDEAGQEYTQERYYYSTVTVIPATIIYYEDNFLKYYTDTLQSDGSCNRTEGGWTSDGETSDGLQQQDRPGAGLSNIDADNIYGTDSAYTNMTAYSYGSAKKIKVRNDGVSGIAEFTFWGTGFDVISLSSNTTGVVLVMVSDAETGKEVANFMVDTYYGYCFNTETGKWEVNPNASATLYQVPVIKADLSKVVKVKDDDTTPDVDETEYYGYGHYKVEIDVSYSSWFAHEQCNCDASASCAGCYDFYLDAIRIYNPADDGAEDVTVQDAYIADHEYKPSYEELRNHLITKATFDSLGTEDDISGVIFIDGNTALNDSSASGVTGSSIDTEVKSAVADYANYGPNNELYLATGQAVSFKLDAVEDIDKLHLALKSVGGSAEATVYGLDGSSATYILNDQTINTATDLYYNITDLIGKTVVILNSGDSGILSVTNLKTTYLASGNASGTCVMSVSPSSVALALASLNEGAPAPVEPTEGSISMSYATLSFEDEIIMNAYFTLEGIEVDPSELGMITFSSDATDGTVDNAEAVIHGGMYHSADGSYSVNTEGIAAKNLGDTIYFRVYARLADGSYVYSSPVSYSPKVYANTILNGNYSVEMKALVVAMLNYGAAAQTYFGYNTEALVNAHLTAEQQALVVAYSSDMMPSISASVDDTKAGTFASNGGFSSRYPTVSFEGTFCINYYCVPSVTPVGDLTMYYWTQSAFDAAEVLTAENATAAIVMTNDGAGNYQATVSGISAKDLDQGVYVSFVYDHGTTTYASGVLGYSIGTYCNIQSTSGSTVAALAEATAVYGYYAKQYFYALT